MVMMTGCIETCLFQIGTSSLLVILHLACFNVCCLVLKLYGRVNVTGLKITWRRQVILMMMLLLLVLVLLMVLLVVLVLLLVVVLMIIHGCFFYLLVEK